RAPQLSGIVHTKKAASFSLITHHLKRYGPGKTARRRGHNVLGDTESAQISGLTGAPFSAGAGVVGRGGRV
ncbi:MAG TPA: hypothetical protein VF621_10205, partial [Pyrinomonadaceae bacterium]